MNCKTNDSDSKDVFEALENAKTEEMDAVENIEEFEERIERIREIMEWSDSDCLHEELEESLPPNQRGGPHMLSCPCPKCTPRV